MNLTVDLFREPWGRKRPGLASVRARVLQMGFTHAMLHTVAGRWWLTLASDAIVDSVMMLAVAVKAKHTALIVAELPLPTLIVWHDGQLQQIEQGSLTSLFALVAEQEQQTTLPIQRLHYRLTASVPDRWQHSVDISQQVDAHPLLPLEQLHQLPMFRRQQRHLLMALLALVLVLCGLLAWWLRQGTPAVNTTADKSVTPPASYHYLSAPHALDKLIAASISPQQGAWRLTQVSIKDYQLTRLYQGQPPLALWQVHADAPGVDWNLTQFQQVEPLTRSRKQGGLPTSKRDVSALQHKLLLAGLPQASVQRRGEGLTIVWRQWSLSRLKQLQKLLGDNLWHLLSATLAPDTIGWQGQLRLTLPPRQARNAS